MNGFAGKESKENEGKAEGGEGDSQGKVENG